jgi:hypothetical protein
MNMSTENDVQENEDSSGQNTEAAAINPLRWYIIAGDSLTKHLHGYRMSTRKSKVQVSTFSGWRIILSQFYAKSPTRWYK